MNDEHLLPGPLTDEEVTKRAELMAGLFKLLVTLNSSAIGLIVIFASHFATENLFAKILLAFAPIAFLSSLVGSFMMVFGMTMRQAPRNVLPNEMDKEEWWFFGFSFIGFIVGVACLLLPAAFRFIGLLPQWAEIVLSLCAIAGFIFFVVRKIMSKRKAVGNT